ncbi:MAG: PLP-dependent aminotransferase family protein [bacterium]
MAVLTALSGRALAALLPDLRVAPGSAYTALARAILSLLLDGRVAPATRLPSERELAAALGLSRATVTAAYNALRADGLLSSRTGSGSVTVLPRGVGPAGGGGSTNGRGAAAGASSGPGRRALSAARRPAGRPASRYADIRPLVEAAPAEDLIDLSCATFPAPAQLPELVVRATAALGPHLSGSGYEPTGLPALRERIAARFTARGVPTTTDQILVTNGALHALDLVLRLLVGPGERVLTELPTYAGLLDAVRASGARALAVPVAPEGGWQLAAMTAALRHGSPRLAVLIPDFHNPTGHLVPDGDRAELLRAARRAGTTVVVDESFVDVGFVAPATPAAAIDPGVVSVGSLSKPVWGGLRLGWVRAPVRLIERLAMVRAATDMGQAVLEQLIGIEVFDRLDEITAARIEQVRPRRDFLLDRLAETLPAWRAPVPSGGLSLWVELDAPLATPLVMRAAQYGVRIVAGSRFGVDGTMERFLRLPYALPEDQLATAVQRIAAAWSDLGAGGSGYQPLIVA